MTPVNRRDDERREKPDQQNPSRYSGDQPPSQQDASEPPSECEAVAGSVGPRDLPVPYLRMAMARASKLAATCASEPIDAM